MKIKNGFILRKVGDSSVVITVGEAAKNFKGMIKLNETGAFIWSLISDNKTVDEIASAMTEEYEITKEQAKADAEAFINKLKENNVLED